MAKLPAFQFYTGDWLKDPKLSMCSPSTRGIWIDLLCAMHELDRSGQITGTPDQFARICRCTAVEFVQALDELKSSDSANVTERNGNVTVVNRRMKREDGERKSSKERVLRHREKKKRESNAGCNKNVTSYSSSSSSVSVSKVNNNNPACGEPPPRKFEDARFSFTTADMQRLVNLWNSFSTEKIKLAVAFNLTPQVIQVLLRDDLCLTKEGLFACFENYRKARGLKNTKAHPWTFGQFLQRDCALPKFREGFFRLEDYGEWEPRSRDRPAALTDEEKRKRDEQIRRELEAEGVKTT